MISASAQAQGFPSLTGGIGGGSSGGSSGSSDDERRPEQLPFLLGVCGARYDETIETPEVNCDQNQDLVTRVEEYYDYAPPADNRQALVNDVGQQINITGVRDKSKPPGHLLDHVNCENLDNNDPVSEPCQDNRWRDTCLVGRTPFDLDFATYLRPVEGNEEPFSGVAGAAPLFDINDNSKINCMVPKNTENIAALRLDNGWRFRHSCPGDPALERLQQDEFKQKTDLFRGITTDTGQALFNCWAPLPKCDLQSDWKIGTTTWLGTQIGSAVSGSGGINLGNIGSQIGSQLGTILGGGSFGGTGQTIGEEHGKFIDLFNPASTNPITGAINNLLGGLLPTATTGTLERLLSRYPNKAQRDAAIDWLQNTLLKPEVSRAAECKPAYWVRYMFDSCGNQFLQKAFSPSYTFDTSGSRTPGLSPRSCQPLKTVDVIDHEYDPHDFLLRTAIGLLHEDYMPTIKFDRFKKPGAQNEWENALEAQGYPVKGTIAGLGMNAGGQLEKIAAQFGKPDINEYANTNVERILDALHPFSPRYDVAETTSGEFITDRTLFKGETESDAKSQILFAGCGFPCKAKTEGEGYFEFGESVYCSAVSVDVLRFRYTDYRICMGCHIDTNERAFWEEVEVNKKHYEKERCGKGRFLPFRKSKYDDCEYCEQLSFEDDVCGSCHRSNWNMILYGICCLATGGGGCGACEGRLKKATKYGLICNLSCKPLAENEALEGARQQRNEVAEPEWGPTAMGPDGPDNTATIPFAHNNKWPVCSTRFDHEGDPEMCKEAKQEYGDCQEQALHAANTDPNMPQAAEKNAATQCAQNRDIDDICGDAAQPVVALNILKMRPDIGGAQTDQPEKFETKRWKNETSEFPEILASYRQQLPDEHPKELKFRHYFGGNRPYMRLWDTGKELMQKNSSGLIANDEPDYWCDFASNTAVVGIGREENSIHGKKSQLCRYIGGDSIGDSCFEVGKWKKRFPSLAGSEWAELKMYQARCFRRDGLNCLCQYEKIFKDEGSEEFALNSLAGSIPTYQTLKQKGVAIGIPNATDGVLKDIPTLDASSEIKSIMNVPMPFSWRGYASTPANRDTVTTSPAISVNQQFPNLYGATAAASTPTLNLPSLQQMLGMSLNNLINTFLQELQNAGVDEILAQLKSLLPQLTVEQLRQRLEQLLPNLTKEQLETELQNLIGNFSLQELQTKLQQLLTNLSVTEAQQQLQQLLTSLSSIELGTLLQQIAQNWGITELKTNIESYYQQLSPQQLVTTLQQRILSYNKQDLINWISANQSGLDPQSLWQMTLAELQTMGTNMLGSLSPQQILTQLSAPITNFSLNQLLEELYRVVPILNLQQLLTEVSSHVTSMSEQEILNALSSLIPNISEQQLESLLQNLIPNLTEQELLSELQSLIPFLNKSEVLARLNTLVSFLSPAEMLQWLQELLLQLGKEELINLLQQLMNNSGAAGAIINGQGLGQTIPGDVVVWPAGLNPPTLPRVAVVEEVHTKLSLGAGFGGGREYIIVRDANNGKFPDICGNTTMLGYGPRQFIYPNMTSMADALGEDIKALLEEQVVATYYCDDPYLLHCVDRHWDDVIIFRPHSIARREPNT